MKEEIFLNNLNSIFDKTNIKTDTLNKEKYRNDWSTKYESDPIAIVFPKEVDQVTEVIKLCNESNYPIIGSGGRTGLSGGAAALSNELIMSFEKMDNILDFDETSKTVLCQSGLITENLQSFADENNLYYPVNFSSSGSSQIGGNISTNAGGIRVIKYGSTSRYVNGLEVITGNGDKLKMDNMMVKNATGPDLKNFFIASEGIFGLITTCRIQLIQKPIETDVILLGFDDLSYLEKITKMIFNFDIEAAEFFTKESVVKVSNEFDHVDIDHLNNNYYLIVEYFEDHKFLDALERLYKATKNIEIIMSTNKSQKNSIWDYRMLISESISRKSPIKFDIAVPVKYVSKLIHRLELHFKKNSDYELILFGHIGDGNLHINILKNSVNSSDVTELENKIHSIVLDLKGTLSAEHGIGANKIKIFMKYENKIKIELFKNLKNYFDSNWILNPGKLISK